MKQGSTVLNPEEGSQRVDHLKLHSKTDLKKLKPFDLALNSLIKIVPNKGYEAVRPEDQASFSIVFNTGEIIGLEEIDRRQRMVEAGFEAQIHQLCAFEKRKFMEYRDEDQTVFNELQSRKAELTEKIHEAEVNIAQSKAKAKAEGLKSPRVIGKQRVEAKPHVKQEPNQ